MSININKFEAIILLMSLYRGDEMGKEKTATMQDFTDDWALSVKEAADESPNEMMELILSEYED